MSKKNKQFWEQFQSNYKGQYGYQWGGETVLSEVSEICKPFIKGKSILEIGCGGGKWTKALFDRMEAKSVDACDVHKIAVNQTREHESRANVFLIDGKGIKTTKKYDLVFSYDVLLHFPSSLVMKYILDSKKCSEGFIFQLPDLNTRIGSELFTWYAEHEIYEDPYTKGYMNFYTAEMVEAMAKIAGYQQAKDLGVIGDRDRLYLLK